MRITFVLHKLQLSGGHKAVFALANCLHRFGHRVRVVYPVFAIGPPLNRWTLRTVPDRLLLGLKGLRQTVRIDWYDLDAELQRVTAPINRCLPDADLVVATWWETAFWVKALGPEKGKKFYLVQHYETWGGPRAMVDRSYRLGLEMVVHSGWLKDLLEQRLGVPVKALVPHAPDLEQFYPRPRRAAGPVRVLMPYRDMAWKGVADGIRAFQTARNRFPETQLVLFGPTRGADVPPDAEFHERPFKSRLRDIYNSCDIFVFPSRQEGFGMPPMEAMACRCAVVATRVGAVPDYALDGKTALLVPPRSPDQLAQALIRLIAEPDLRAHLAEAGYRHILDHYSWETSARQLEHVFLEG